MPLRRAQSMLLAAVALAAMACTAEPELPAWAVATARPAPDATAVAAPVADAPPGAAGAADPALGPDLRVLTFGPDEAVAFDVGPGDVSWALGVAGGTSDDLVGVRRVRDPAGETRYLADLRSGLLLVDELHPRVLADAGAVGLYVTAPTGGALAQGTWTVDVAANQGAPSTRVVIRSGDAAGPQRLDVVGWVTTDLPDPAATAGAWRAAMDGVLAPHGIAVGRLDLVPAGPDGERFRRLGVDGLADEVHEACTAATAATGAPARTAVVVLAEQIGEGVLTADVGVRAYRGPDGQVDGFAVATPGTPVVGPASHACVAVNALGDPDARGLVALHEILHQAGLTRHTTEEDGRAFDHLADTPECPADRHDADADGQVDRAECADLDGDNLMFWAVGGTSLTPDQAWRVRAHPLLQPR